MKHKHYEMGVAKLADTSLVKFIKLNHGWVATRSEDWNVASDYFLCLPQHKEACLHWLNGGEVQMAHKGEFYNVSSVSLRCVDGWNDRCAFMDDSFELRAKPKKEKRLIGVGRNAFTTAHYSLDDRHLLETTIQNLCPDAVVIEIEVEV